MNYLWVSPSSFLSCLNIVFATLRKWIFMAFLEFIFKFFFVVFFDHTFVCWLYHRICWVEINIVNIMVIFSISWSSSCLIFFKCWSVLVDQLHINFPIFSNFFLAAELFTTCNTTAKYHTQNNHNNAKRCQKVRWCILRRDKQFLIDDFKLGVFCSFWPILKAECSIKRIVFWHNSNNKGRVKVYFILLFKIWFRLFVFHDLFCVCKVSIYCLS